MSNRDDTLPEGLTFETDEFPAAPLEGGVLVVDEGGARRIVELEPRRNAIGSGAGADLQLRGRGVEEEHLVLEPVAGGLRAVAGGLVFRNGRRLADAALASGDRLRVGTVVLRYVARGDVVQLPALSAPRPPGLLWWAASGWAIGYLAALVVVVAGLAGPAAAGGSGEGSVGRLEAAAAEAARQDEPPVESEALVPVDGEDEQPEPVVEQPVADSDVAIASAPGEQDVPGEAGPQQPAPPNPLAVVGPAVPKEKRAEVALLPRRQEGGRRARRAVPEGEKPIGRMWAAWEAGAFDDLAAAGWGASDLEVRRLALLAERFGRALAEARAARGVAAVPALERALGLAEEIGRDAPHVREVRHALAAHHRVAARRATDQGDLRGAVHHCEQALAVLPQDGEARALRSQLGTKARTLFLEGYALQHLDPSGALRLAELAALVATPGDVDGEKAADLAARLREEVGGPGAAGRL